MNYPVKLFSSNINNYSNLKGDQLPVPYRNSVPQPSIDSHPKRPIVSAQEDSGEKLEKVFCQCTGEVFSSETISFKGFLSSTPSLSAFLQKTQLAAYQKADALQPPPGDEPSAGIDLYL